MSLLHGQAGSSPLAREVQPSVSLGPEGPAGLVQMSAGSTCQQGGLVSRSAGDSPGLLPGATGHSPKRVDATKNSLSCPASKPTPYHSCHIPLAKESYKASLGSGGEIDSQSHVTRAGFC